MVLQDHLQGYQSPLLLVAVEFLLLGADDGDRVSLRLLDTAEGRRLVTYNFGHTGHKFSAAERANI